MCTGFVHKGKDRICGFNMDLPDVTLDWKLIMDQECFYVGLRPALRPELLPEGMLDAVKQVQWAPTQVSFVYSQNENRVYYTLQLDFSHIRSSMVTVDYCGVNGY